MTLEYASPEQVSGGTVTTVSDVYSLGVVLYRLLTGQSPYGARTNDAQRVAEILATPHRLARAWCAPTIAAQRGIDADLDNILLMALRKEPQRRYGSVEQFANDLRNYLSGLPVQARGNALRYRMGKFLRRRKVEIAAAADGGVRPCSADWVSRCAKRVIAEHQRQVAQRHFDRLCARWRTACCSSSTMRSRRRRNPSRRARCWSIPHSSTLGYPEQKHGFRPCTSGRAGGGVPQGR